MGYCKGEDGAEVSARAPQASENNCTSPRVEETSRRSVQEDVQDAGAGGGEETQGEPG